MRRYLFVDDNRALAENLAEIVQDTDAGEVEIATSGEEALRLAAGARFDALVSDMRMPFMGGAELVHRIRGVDPGLPAIVITAYTQDSDLQAAREEGLLCVLPKPAPIDRLLALLMTARRDGLVALVEDDAALADNLCEVLRGRGYAAVTARSVVEAERLGRVRPFSALVDLRLPGGPDGEAMRRLAARFPGLPMLVITGLVDATPPIEALGVWSKPFDTGALLDTIDRLHRTLHG